VLVGCFLLLFTVPIAAQVLSVNKLVGKTYVERGEPVPVTILLRGNQKKLCQSSRLAIVVDVSGSLKLWHGAVQTAVIASLPLITFGPDKIAVASFKGNFNTLQSWTDDPNLVKKALANLQSGGMTNLPKAIKGTNALMQLMPGNPDCKAALIVTDGQKGTGGLPSASTLKVAKTNGWKYFFLGVGNQDKNNLNWMASESGGTYLDTSLPPYSGSVSTGIVAAVNAFMQSALKIVAPSNIVISEVVASGLNVVKVSPPTVPPNQANPTTYTTAAATAWAKLKSTGKATLPSIDKLDKDISGAMKEYSVHFEVSVNTCDDKKAIPYYVDGPGAQVTYFVNSIKKTVLIPNIQFTVRPCDMPITKSWNSEEKSVTLELKNNFAYTVTEVELFEVLNYPLVIKSTSPLASLGSTGDSYARFDISNMTSGTKVTVKLLIEPTTPFSNLVGDIQVNDLTDSYLSFTVPYFASEFGPTSTHHPTLVSAISAGVVGPAGKKILEKAAFAVPHAQDTEVDKSQNILTNTYKVWPEFDWSVEGDEGTFLIKQVGSSYQIYIAHKKWKKLPELYVPRVELNP